MAVSKQSTATLETYSADGLDEEVSCRGEARWKRFHPFRVVRKIFRRRIKREGTSVSDSSKKSWSTSELQDDSTGKQEVTSPLKVGFSVSHDSIFSPETNMNDMNNETLNISHSSLLSVDQTTTKNMFKDELFSRIHAKRNSNDVLPQNLSTSPTVISFMTQDLKEKSPEFQNKCTLESLESFKNQEESEDSSRRAIIDRRSMDSDGDNDTSEPVPLNHNAAHHKISVRPKRNYGLPHRRINQSTAPRLNTLPTTPEVTGESEKSFLRLKVAETFTELSSSSTNEFFTTKESSVWKMSRMKQSFSYDKVSELSKEFINQIDKASTLESKNNNENMEEFLNSGDTKSSLNNDPLKSETKETVTEIFSSKENNPEFTITEETKSFFDSYEKICDNTEAENFIPLIKKNKSDTMTEMKENETSLNTLSLVRDLKKSEKSIIGEVETKSQNFGIEPELSSIQFKVSNTRVENSEAFQSDVMIENFCPKIHLNKTNEYVSSIVEKSEIKVQQEYVKEVKISNQLDIDSEFILKTAKKEDECIDNENPLISLNFEDESTLREKSLSTVVEENGIFISHYASLNDVIKNRAITEAHNFAAAEESAGIFIHASSDVPKTIDSCISPIDLPASISINSAVAINSSTSLINTNKITDEKITISVNAKPEAITPPINKDFFALESENAELLCKQDINELVPLKEKSANKSTSEHQVPKPNSRKNPQKRLSVEIVPFSQRMKERKYQPISFCNESSISDQKKNSNSLMEKKLSEHKVTVKNEEMDKSNDQNSFSVALLSDCTNTETVIEKKAVEMEKLEHPVQIRIHKSNTKSESKDKVGFSAATKGQKNSANDTTSTEGKLFGQSSKTMKNNTKITKEKKDILDTFAQPSISPNITINKSQIANNDLNSFRLINGVSTETRYESGQSSVIENESEVCHNNEESELLPMNSNKNIKKNTKEAVLINDPEPELLRVFARRSIKQKNGDKGKTKELQESFDVPSDNNSDMDKTEDGNEISILDNSTVIKILEISKPHITHDLKKKSKSFSEKSVPRSVLNLKEINLIPKESFTKLICDSSVTNQMIHSRQRLPNNPDLPLNLPPDSVKESDRESLPRSSTSSVALENTESQEPLSEKSPPWLQLAQQRRELREQRERLLLGSSPNSFMDVSNKPARSSKVWDMVNNFQKLQMT